MKRIAALLLALTVAAGLLSGCAQENRTAEPSSTAETAADSQLPQELESFTFSELVGEEIKPEELTGSWKLCWVALDAGKLTTYDAPACSYTFTRENRLEVSIEGESTYYVDLVIDKDMLYYFYDGQQENTYAMCSLREIGGESYLIYVEFSNGGSESTTLIFRPTEV